MVKQLGIYISGTVHDPQYIVRKKLHNDRLRSNAYTPSSGVLSHKACIFPALFQDLQLLVICPFAFSAPFYKR